MNRHTVPKEERSVFFTRVDALRPSDPPLAVSAAADNNVMRLSENCLFMRTAFGSMFGGRYGISWWATVAVLFLFVPFSVGTYVAYVHQRQYEGYGGGVSAFFMENWDVFIGAPVAFAFACIWLYIPWRTQLPIIFNRRTRKVSCFVQGTWVSQHWDGLEAYIKDVTTFAAGGAPINEGVLTLAFPYSIQHSQRINQKLRVGITGTQDDAQAIINRGIYGAAQIWEFIRLFMREGPSALPLSSARTPYSISHSSEAVRHFNPLKVLKVKHAAWLLFAVPFFIFIALPVAPMLMLGDISYMWLDRMLPRRQWPQELIDACDGEWDGRE
ncbi:DUF6708 domain-containing protein [Achromobacter animicus]|uniref:DUF6708 domain-containing protein n=1 Tax=Achromobacter animicus TaxID=1389935 RepID=UPI00244906C5|nr:DUF6708 domain-containing protein [Achromobacter animicus]MDH0681236.1 hypothetical protein [Achromobacter animicus]